MPAGAAATQPTATVRPVLRRVDLLKHIDPKLDAIYGEWRKDGNALSAYGGNHVNLEIPYAPPEEYDLLIKFNGLGPGESVSAICSTKGRSQKLERFMNRPI